MFSDIPVEIVLFNFGWVGSIVSGISALALGNRSLPQELNQWLLLLLMGKSERIKSKHMLEIRTIV